MAKHRKKGEQAAFLLYNDSKIYFDNCPETLDIPAYV